MRIAVAPNAFRGSLTALQATDAIIAGLMRSALNTDGTLQSLPMPLADGGDGTLEILSRSGTLITMTVTGPNGAPVQAQMGLLPDNTAVIEMARASGVELIPRSERNPLTATSYGTGELIREAIRRGCKRIVVGIGGSATIDGAAGCLQALGVHLLDTTGAEILGNGGGLAQLASIDASPLRALVQDVKISVLCDVTNPLIGPDGAAYVFGPQKGANAAAVELLDANLTHYADIVRRDLGVDLAMMPGAGAAGGLGAGLVACAGAKLAPGGPTLISILGYDKQLAGADLVITGEGKLDAQTSGGKAVQSIAAAARRVNVPVVALAGTVESDPAALRDIGISAAWSIVPGPCSLDEALAHGEEWLSRAAESVGNMLALSQR